MPQTKQMVILALERLKHLGLFIFSVQQERSDQDYGDRSESGRLDLDHIVLFEITSLKQTHIRNSPS